jgi:hypothetical protein
VFLGGDDGETEKVTKPRCFGVLGVGRFGSGKELHGLLLLTLDYDYGLLIVQLTTDECWLMFSYSYLQGRHNSTRMNILSTLRCLFQIDKMFLLGPTDYQFI